MKKLLGFGALLLSAVIFGSFGIWIRFLGEQLSMYQQIVLRNTVAAVLSIGIVLIGRKLTSGISKAKKSNIVFYAIAVPLSVVFYNISMLNVKIAVATFVFYVGTIAFSTIISTLFFKEKMTSVKIVSLTCVVIGLACFAYPFSKESLTFGLLAGVISGLFDAISNAFRKDLSGKVDKFLLVLFTAVGGMIVAGGMALYFKQNLGFFTEMSTKTTLVGLLFGALLVGVNYLLLVGFQNFDLSLGTIVLSAELMFALLFGFLVFGEVPTTAEVLGGLFVLVAIIVPNLNVISKRFRRMLSKGKLATK